MPDDSYCLIFSPQTATREDGVSDEISMTDCVIDGVAGVPTFKFTVSHDYEIENSDADGGVAVGDLPIVFAPCSRSGGDFSIGLYEAELEEMVGYISQEESQKLVEAIPDVGGIYAVVELEETTETDVLDFNTPYHDGSWMIEDLLGEGIEDVDLGV